MKKKLYLSKNDKKLAGVCGGIGEFFEVDPTLIRLGWALFALTGAGVVAYVIAAVVMPDRPMVE